DPAPDGRATQHLQPGHRADQQNQATATLSDLTLVVPDRDVSGPLRSAHKVWTTLWSMPPKPRLVPIRFSQMAIHRSCGQAVDDADGIGDLGERTGYGGWTAIPASTEERRTPRG